MSLASRLIDTLKQLDASVAPWLTCQTSEPRALPDKPSDVLVVRLWGLGNFALLVPSLTKFSGRLRILTLERHRTFLETQLPNAELLTQPEPHHPLLPLRLGQHLRTLHRAPPQLVVDLETFLHLPLALARRATQAPCVGLDTPGQQRAALLDRAVPFDSTEHVAQRFARVLRAARMPSVQGPGPLVLSRNAQSGLHAQLGQQRAQFVVLHPGSGDHFPGRRWAPERFAELARALQRRQIEVWLTGTSRERRLVQQVARLSGGAARSLAGQLNVNALLALLDEAALLVTNDTGPLHLADALGTPCVALYGPNTPHRYGPRGAASRALFADLPCSPCLDDRGRKRSHCRDFACMRALPVSAVLAACDALLDNAPIRHSPAGTTLHEFA